MDRKIIAKAYRDILGFNIIPFYPKSKKPAIAWKNEYGLHKRKLTDQEINELWEDPTTNIGVILGETSGVFVLDIDSQEALDWMMKKSKGKEPDTCYVQTSKPYKRHYYFKYPDWDVPSIDGRCRYFRVDFEIKPNNILATLPPSDHKDYDDVVYTWIRSPFKEPINEMPAWLRLEIKAYMMNKENDKTRHIEQQRKYKNKSIPKNAPFPNEWQRDYINGVGQGNRNKTCFVLAGFMKQRELLQKEAVSLLSSWNRKNQPQLKESEIITSVRSAYAR